VRSIHFTRCKKANFWVVGPPTARKTTTMPVMHGLLTPQRYPAPSWGYDLLSQSGIGTADDWLFSQYAAWSASPSGRRTYCVRQLYGMRPRRRRGAHWPPSAILQLESFAERRTTYLFRPGANDDLRSCLSIVHEPAIAISG